MGARARVDEGQDHRAARAQILGLDRRLHPLVALHLPADVDLQAGVRRVGPVHRAPQVLLSCDEIEGGCGMTRARLALRASGRGAGQGAGRLALAMYLTSVSVNYQ